MKTEPFLILDRLSVGYGRVPVLQNVTIGVQKGSLTAVLGGNGSGKTTLLKTVAGILPPLAGEIRYAHDSGRLPGIGYVPQRESLDPLYLLSAMEVVVMGTYGRVPAGRRPGRAERAFALACLRATDAEEVGDRLYSELSGGQKQRILIARALATRPELLLLDEPITGIDTAASKLILDLLLRIHREQELTILLVTHDLPTVRKQFQDVIWIHSGQVEHGPVSKLLQLDRLAELLELS